MKRSNGLRGLVLAAGLALGQSAAAATLDLDFNYRLTPEDGPTGTTIATARFEDNPNGGIDLYLTNVASNYFPVSGGSQITYISGLLFSFGFEDAELPAIVALNQPDDSAHSDRWEPQEDVATVDGFTFTSELGFPRSEVGCTGCRLGVGDTGHVLFLEDPDASPPLPVSLTVATIVNAIRNPDASPNAPTIMAAVKVRGINTIVGGEDIESVQTIVVGAAAPAPVPVPAALPLFLSALGGIGILRRRGSNA